MEHPELIVVQRSKRSHENLYRVMIGFVMGLLFMWFYGIIARAEQPNVLIIYPEDYYIAADILEQQRVEVGKGPEYKEPEFIYSEKVPLKREVQEYIWNKCKEATDDYVEYYYFMLGAIELESTFRANVTHNNGDGSIDRGLCQINSKNIKKMKSQGLINCTDDLFDIYKNIDCGFAIMNPFIETFGVTEAAYYGYNTGVEKKNGSNKNSRAVMRNMAAWKDILQEV